MYICFQFTVRASDLGTPSQSADIIVTIRIRREGNPVFTLSEYIVTLPEDQALDSSIITVSASDPLNVSPSSSSSSSSRIRNGP